MSTTIRASKLIDACTPSISYDPQVQSGCAAFDAQMYEIIDDTGQVIMIPSIMDIQDEKLIDILAWQFHVDFYDATRDLEFRKKLVQMSIQWHIRKGTHDLVEEVLNTYWPGTASLLEWFEYMDPLPPNYPTVAPDTKITTFTPAQVSTLTDQFTIPSHGLSNGDQVRFVLGQFCKLPTPIVQTFFYYVVNVAGNTFKISTLLNGLPIDITDSGAGTLNEIWKRGIGTWHDRYRFRVYIDSRSLSVDDYTEVLTLIQNYKPISRWLEGIYRAYTSDCMIGWCGAMLRFVYRESQQPG